MTFRALLAAALLLLAPAAALADPAAADLARSAAEAVAVLKGERAAADVFDQHFLAEVPPAQLAALAAQLQAQNGAIASAEDVRPDGATSATNINDPVIAEAPVGDPSFPTTTDLRFLVTCEGLDLATKRPESLKLG